jgi:acyl-CoA thioester hydrolase
LKPKEWDVKFELPEQKKLVHESVIPIRWGDMDAMGHLNNTTYFRYAETIRMDWLNAIGAMSNPLGEGPVILNAFCNFYRQLEYPGDVRMRMYTSDPARTTFETWYTMGLVDDPDTVYAAGGATTIWVDFPKQKAVSMPDWLRTLVS